MEETKTNWEKKAEEKKRQRGTVIQLCKWSFQTKKNNIRYFTDIMFLLL